MTTVCAGDGTQFIVKWRDGWWVVLSGPNREQVSGGFKRSYEAIREARRLAAERDQ